MTDNPFFRALLIRRWDDRGYDGGFGLYYVAILAALWLLAPRVGRTQEPATPMQPKTSLVTDTTGMTSAPAGTETGITRVPADKPAVESEIAVMGMIPDGDYRIFSATVRCNAWVATVEYDRHSWGRLLKSRVDYVGEVIPLIVLSEPAISDFWGNAKSPNQKLLYGLSVAPFGFRFLWRDCRAVKPYLIGKLGTAVFTEKALSPNASYANFNVQAAFGLQFRLTDRVDLRVEPFEFYHVSNGYLAASNPGMDELASKFGISYHLGRLQGR